MKRFKKGLLIVIIIIFLSIAGLYAYLLGLKPQYSGKHVLPGLLEEVETIFDEYGIPHIYAKNEHDLYFALGFLHAQERLFQMEILRRIGAGRLSEIFGKKLVKTDAFFRTLGFVEKAAQAANENFSHVKEPWQKAAMAYLNGVNSFVDHGDPPVEFTILGIPKEKFTPKDIYLTGAFMAFGFAEGFKMDPLIENINRLLGPDYLKDLAIHWKPGTLKIPVHAPPKANLFERQRGCFRKIFADLPVPSWIGSNGWVLSPAKSESGRVLFSNDTHMAYSQPSVWFEAHLECPGFSFYGNHVAGIPFALIGHNRFAAWGLTMFENDDVDFYVETPNPDNLNQVWENDHWQNLRKRKETIKVKNGKDAEINVLTSRHGPIVNSVMDEIGQFESRPVSVWWAFHECQITTIQAMYLLGHMKNINEARQAASMIDVPGLNVMYGDMEGNIAWWACAKLVKRPQHVNSKFFLDGASGKDDPLGFYSFSENPMSENPPSGYVYSANNQPDMSSGIIYPGYYVPEDRAKRITTLLESQTKWSIDEIKKMSTDNISPVAVQLVKEILHVVKPESFPFKSRNHEKVVAILLNWDGNHETDNVAPTIYYKLMTCILESTFTDELGQDICRDLISSHLMKRTAAHLIRNADSIWWDDIKTERVRETRKLIFSQAFDQAIQELEQQLGKNPENWQWGKVHTLEHAHLLGRQKPLDKIFNLGPYPVAGGNEVINNTGFQLSRDGNYKVSFGPSMRILIDFAKIEHSISINPTGQSGCFMSRHYRDQTALFNQCGFRLQMMNRKNIEKNQKGRLLLLPE